jgi:hypothetical protein
MASCDVSVVLIVCRWNSGRSQVELYVADPLFEGFDCEDSVQSFMQIIQTAMKHKDDLLRCMHTNICIFVLNFFWYKCCLCASCGFVGRGRGEHRQSLAQTQVVVDP